MKLIDTISWLMGRVQRSLFPHLNQCLPTPLTEQEERLVSILEIVQVERYVPINIANYRYPGRKPFDRQALGRAFVAKAYYRLATTTDLRRIILAAVNLRRICGFVTADDVPSDSTFSRAFSEFATGSLGNRVHDALVKKYLSQELVGHISRDSTAIIGREKPAKKVKPRKARKRGRPAKGEDRQAALEKRLDRQVNQSTEEAISELPVVCDRGTKKNAQGYKMSWNGYKLHLDTNDIGLPISAIAGELSGKERCIVAHPATPPHLLPVIEIVPAPFTPVAVTEQAMALMDRHGTIGAARTDALDCASRAKAALEALPPHPLRGMLSDLADYVVSRVS